MVDPLSGTYTVLKVVHEVWDLVLKALHVRRKRPGELTYDEESFLSILKARDKESVRHVDGERHRFEFHVYVEQVIFQPGLFSDSNALEFTFSTEVVEYDPKNRHLAIFGKSLRAKAAMLKQGDHILVKGYFYLGPIFSIIHLTDIERL
jgi:hypothetical protein